MLSYCVWADYLYDLGLPGPFVKDEQFMVRAEVSIDELIQTDRTVSDIGFGQVRALLKLL